MSVCALSVGETYEDLYETIKYEALRFHRNMPINKIDDLMSHSSEIFMRAHNTWDASKGKFKNWFKFLLHKIWLERARRDAMRHARLPRKSIELERQSKFNRFDFEQFMEELSSDARFVVELATEDLERFNKANKKSTMRVSAGIKTAVKSTLSELGWSACRISESFKEIAETLYG
jgi:hypothetical protein